MGVANDPTSREAQATAPLNCPPWCEQLHLGTEWDVGGFHHDSAPFVLSLNQCVTSFDDSFLLVGISRHDEAGHSEEPCYVEVQDERGTLIRLTSADCLRLSVALLDAAAEILDVPVTQDPQLEDEVGSSRVSARPELTADQVSPESPTALETEEWRGRSTAAAKRRRAASH
jgi:hypothetical protein